MANNAAIDDNRTRSLIGVDHVTFQIPTTAAINSTTHELLTQATMPDVTHTNTHTGNEELQVFSEGHVCAQNSTDTPLGISATFTGDWQDTLNYSEVIVTVYTDKNSVTDGLDIQWSTDGVTIHAHDNFTISATSGKTFTFQCVARYVRVVYTNDGVAQTYFTLQTQLKRFASKGSSHRLKDTVSQEDDAILTASLIKGFSTAGGGNIVDVKVNPSGALTVDATVTSSTLPTGASTSALQTTGNTLLGGIAGMLPTAYDYCALTEASTSDTWVFKTGGSGGTTITTITINYTSSAKTTISNVAKT